MKPQSLPSTSGLRQELTVNRMVPPPKDPLRLAQSIILFLVMLPLFLAVLPWVQTIPGTGQVVAFGPVERQQDIMSPVKGRVNKWLVSEGFLVKAGDPLVEILDNDPELSRRLGEQAGAQSGKVDALTRNEEALSKQIEALRSTREASRLAALAKIRQTQQKLAAADQKLAAADQSAQVASLQVARIESLRTEGISSERDLDLARLSDRKAEAELRSAQADREAATQAVLEAESGLENKLAEIDAKIAETDAKRQKVQSDREDARTKLLDVETKVARQADRMIRAPRDGTILKLFMADGQGQVKVGSKLATLVPQTEQRSVELFIDGNDAAWVDPGRKVRIQFEGWPAVQFGGWPGAAMGTFGGEIAFVDSTDDGKGNFRVMVRPDYADAPWPRATELRQGVRAKGWILLDTVALGYEAWRQLNGFPPETARSKAPAPKVKGLK
ncbi:MAG: HlyD family efflux transporter periplasmic adaptor subunit [Myxococcota bacterium]